jgi:hypothetical protein
MWLMQALLLAASWYECYRLMQRLLGQDSDKGFLSFAALIHNFGVKFKRHSCINSKLEHPSQPIWGSPSSGMSSAQIADNSHWCLSLRNKSPIPKLGCINWTSTHSHSLSHRITSHHITSHHHEPETQPTQSCSALLYPNRGCGVPI